MSRRLSAGLPRLRADCFGARSQLLLLWLLWLWLLLLLPLQGLAARRLRVGGRVPCIPGLLLLPHRRHLPPPVRQ